MPAEIDTGGPRVLHCDYRADCPIPQIVVASTESSFCTGNRVVGTSIARRVSRNNDKVSLDRNAAPKSRRWFVSRRAEGTSFACPGIAALRRIEPCFNQRNNDASSSSSRTVQRDDHNRHVSRSTESESRLCDFDGDAITEQQWRRDDERSSETNQRLGGSRISTPSRKHDTDTGHDRQGSWCSKRRVLSTRNCSIADRVPTQSSSQSTNDPSRSEGTTYEKLATASTLPSLADETWKEVDATNSRSNESRVAKVAGTHHRRADFPSSEHGTLRTRRKKKKKRRECSNDRRGSYIQLLLLLLLVAFGQCGLRGSGVFNNSAKTGTTGLSVLAIGTVISAVSAAPVDLMGDAGIRAERSANLSHITGASRKIQMYIKNRHLQILPDGTVNGSNDDTSDYTIFQRTSVSRGQLRIQSVATCLYLCMDSCGLLYGSREYTDDCVFNETLEQHNYNTYSSAKWSTAKKTLYLGLNRRGQPRRVQTKGHNLGRLSAYARVLTQVAPLERVEALQRRMLGAKHNIRHRHNSHRGDLQHPLCPTLPAEEKDGRDRFRCRKRQKRKKKKRKCRPGEKQDNTQNCTALPVRNEGPPTNGTTPESKRSCEGAASDEACRREAFSVPSKKRKLRVESKASDAGRRNVTMSNTNGKSKAPASNAKTALGSNSESKKPNSTGKKKKKKGPAAGPRRKPAVPLSQKRFTPGRLDNTSAVPTATSASTSVTSSSSWWYPGASTVPSGRGGSPKRSRTKSPSSSRNVSVGSNAPGSRRVGKAFGRNRSRTTAHETTAAPTTVLDRSLIQSVTVKVPEIISDQIGPSKSIDIAEEDSSRLFETIDEDASSTVSIEHGTTTIDSILEATSIEIDLATTTLRPIEEEEDKSLEESDDAEDSGRLDMPETVQSTTPGIPIERLAM